MSLSQTQNKRFCREVCRRCTKAIYVKKFFFGQNRKSSKGLRSKRSCLEFLLILFSQHWGMLISLIPSREKSFLFHWEIEHMLKVSKSRHFYLCVESNLVIFCRLSWRQRRKEKIPNLHEVNNIQTSRRWLCHIFRHHSSWLVNHRADRQNRSQNYVVQNFKLNATLILNFEISCNSCFHKKSHCTQQNGNFSVLAA